MVEKFKTKEEFLEFLDKEIHNLDKVKEILVAFRVSGKYVDKKAKEMGIPEEWLKDPQVYDKFKTYLVYKTFSELIKNKIIDVAIALKKFFEEKSKEKLEKVS
jgi:hypothetical protein